jgi:hypothetical protein
MHYAGDVIESKACSLPSKNSIVAEAGGDGRPAFILGLFSRPHDEHPGKRARFPLA